MVAIFWNAQLISDPISWFPDTSCSQTPPDGQPWPRKAVDFYSFLVKLAPVFRGTRTASGKVGRSPRPERWCSRRNPSKITLNHDCIWLLIWSKLHRHHIIYKYTSFLLLDMWSSRVSFNLHLHGFFYRKFLPGVAILSTNGIVWEAGRSWFCDKTTQQRTGRWSQLATSSFPVQGYQGFMTLVISAEVARTDGSKETTSHWPALPDFHVPEN